MVFESYKIHFFCHSYFDLSHDLMLKYVFTNIFFTAHTSLGCRKYLIGMLFDRKPDELLSGIRVAAHVIFKLREEDAMYDALFAPLSNYRESQQAYKTLSCIKTEPEEMVLAPLKPRSERL